MHCKCIENISHLYFALVYITDKVMIQAYVLCFPHQLLSSARHLMKYELPTAKRLILSLLSAPGLEQVEISTLLAWGSLFDIDSTAVRMAVGRLTRQGLLVSPGRGRYSLGPDGELIANTARDWLHAQKRVANWAGEWILVHTAHLGRSQKSALRARERALRLCGFAEFVSGLWCRPANLSEPVSATRARLMTLGLSPEAIVARTAEIPGVGEKELFSLWPRETIEAAYKAHIEAMERSSRHIHELNLAEAAKESFLVGEAVIRQINADPLLPSPMIDARARREMIEMMMDYDALGRDIWRKFNDTQ